MNKNELLMPRLLTVIFIFQTTNESTLSYKILPSN